MRFLNLQLRFLIPLLLTLVAAAYLATPLMDQLTLRWFSRDLNARGALVTNALSDSISAAMSESRVQRLQTLFDRAVQDERLYAIGLCSLDGTLLRRPRAFRRT
jgi:trehalose 6-phosphate synthase